MRVLQISDSQLHSWYTCNRRYGYEKVDRYRLVGDKPEYFQKGGFVHKMMEIYYRLGIPVEGQAPTSISDRLEAALDGATKWALTDDSIDLDAGDMQFMKDSFVQYVDYTKSDGWTPVAVEQFFSIELFRQEDTDEQEGISILYEGIVDLVVEIVGKSGRVPVDHKTSASFKKIRHASILSGQFIGYAVGLGTSEIVENKFGLQTSYGPDKRFIRHPITFDEHVLEEWKGWTVVQALKIDQSIQTGYYEPNFGACHRNCPYSSVCFTRESLRDWKLTKDYIKLPPSTRKVYKAGSYDAE